MKKKFDLRLDNNDLVDGLVEFLPDDPIFVCVGTPLIAYDAFGPYMGTLLSKAGYKVYGHTDRPMSASKIYSYIEEMESDGISVYDDRIVAIDASTINTQHELFKLMLRYSNGVKPGSGAGRRFPEIGTRSILLFAMVSSWSEAEKRQYGACKSLALSAAKLVTKAINEAMNIKRERIMAESAISKED